VPTSEPPQISKNPDERIQMSDVRKESLEKLSFEWSNAVEVITPHVVRISTPEGSGTGFLISNGATSGVCGIATAAHVIDHAHYWEEPIRIEHFESSQSIVVRRDQRAIFLDEARDTAALLFYRANVPLPPKPLPLAPKDMFLKVGSQIGWLGFPAVSAISLCFFAGNVSAWVQEQSAYLVVGVAINGVSGGPAFHLTGMDAMPVVVIGLVTAYVPNRATAEVLPGLSVVRDVTQYHQLAPTFASLEKAQTASSPADQPLRPPAPRSLGETTARRN